MIVEAGKCVPASAVFTNPNAAGADPVNGCGQPLRSGPGGCFAVPGAAITVLVPPLISPGLYQVRVIGLAPSGIVLGRFSDAITLDVR
jgi:hypothetical protein